MLRRDSDMPLVWNVIIGGFNSRKIEVHNVFDHYGLWNDLIKAKRKCKGDRAVFEEELRTSMMYYYWSKCEWEVIVDHWPHHDSWQEEKIDVYDQVMLNWDIFADYVWNNKAKIKKVESE